MKKIVVALDSLKGCLTSIESSGAMAQGIKEYDPQIEVVTVPVSDGGDGMLNAVGGGYGIEFHEIDCVDALMRPIRARYAEVKANKTAIIEMATAAGLSLLKPEEYDVMNSTTYGVGLMIADAVKRGCRNILLGLGGSATNDGGMGMLRALGYRFYDKFGGELILGCGANMVRAARIDCRKVSSAFGKCRVSVACDVSAPFYGEDGAARTFARQKGANEVMLDILDRGLVHLATLYFRTTGRDISYMAGSGAAGGLGGALMAFLNAKLKKGGDLILDTIKFNSKLKGAGLIITGEGSIDSQTLMGKAPYAVLQRGLSHDIPVVAVAGKIADQQLLLDAGFSDIYAITPQGLSREEMMNPKRAIANLRATARVIVEKYRKHLEEA